MDVKIEKNWDMALRSELADSYFSELIEKVKNEYVTKTIFPAYTNIFTAFNLCPLANVKVVILGQDPYHGENQAHGLSFSVKDGVTIPPSLRNIFKEITSDSVQPPEATGDLTRWAKQGVLLLNSTLTVEKDLSGSHQHLGWEQFTDAVITLISQQKTSVVFLLWGNFAQRKRALIDEAKHLVLTAPHPSPLSAYRGFFGCRHFSQTNTYLKASGHTPIKW